MSKCFIYSTNLNKKLQTCFKKYKIKIGAMDFAGSQVKKKKIKKNKNIRQLSNNTPTIKLEEKYQK